MFWSAGGCPRRWAIWAMDACCSAMRARSMALNSCHGPTYILRSWGGVSLVFKVFSPSVWG